MGRSSLPFRYALRAVINARRDGDDMLVRMDDNLDDLHDIVGIPREGLPPILCWGLW
eukprot:m.322747 g.322747  ORF g.322747 m.322747 type:complete len:57 (+) comp55517_c0_seq10:2445-2615(+)